MFTLKENRAEFNRKLLKISSEKQKISYMEPCIEGLQLELEEQRVYKSWLGLEREQQQTQITYRYRETVQP